MPEVDIDLEETVIDGMELRKRDTGDGYAVRFDIEGTVYDVEEGTLQDAFRAERLDPVEIKVEVEEE